MLFRSASWNRGSTFDFRLGAREVIEGWDQGVKGMRVGGRRRLTIPPRFGYGDRGAGGERTECRHLSSQCNTGRGEGEPLAALDHLHAETALGRDDLGIGKGWRSHHGRWHEQFLQGLPKQVGAM